MERIEIRPARYLGWIIRILVIALIGYSAFFQDDAFVITMIVGPMMSVAFVWRYLAGSGKYPSAIWSFAFIPYFFYFLLAQVMPIPIDPVDPIIQQLVLIGFAFLVLVAPTKHSGVLSFSRFRISEDPSATE